MTKVKICGIRTLPEALAAAELGADLLGFNFHPKSVRFVDVRTCARITSVLKKIYPSTLLVGVFVNSSIEQIIVTMETCSLDLAQLHGDETPEFRARLGNRAFKAFRGIPSADIDSYTRGQAPAFLLDAGVSGAYGGTGISADWPTAAKLASYYPLLLAGGLKPENVAQAVRQVRPWGVDVASGVEIRPGEKHPPKMKDFITAVRSVSRHTKRPAAHPMEA